MSLPTNDLRDISVYKIMSVHSVRKDDIFFFCKKKLLAPSQKKTLFLGVAFANILFEFDQS